MRRSLRRGLDRIKVGRHIGLPADRRDHSGTRGVLSAHRDERTPADDQTAAVVQMRDGRRGGPRAGRRCPPGPGCHWGRDGRRFLRGAAPRDGCDPDMGRTPTVVRNYRHGFSSPMRHRGSRRRASACAAPRPADARDAANVRSLAGSSHARHRRAGRVQGRRGETRSHGQAASGSATGSSACLPRPWQNAVVSQRSVTIGCAHAYSPAVHRAARPAGTAGSGSVHDGSFRAASSLRGGPEHDSSGQAG